MRLVWPTSHLTRVLVVFLPLAAIFTIATVGPDYVHHSQASPTQGAPLAVQRQPDPPTTLEIASRNKTRLADLATLGKAMTEFGRTTKRYPSTNGGLQTLCTYETIDIGCALKNTMREVPADPLGRNAGYFYASDGESFTIVSQWEGDGTPPVDFACPAAIHAVKPNARLACVWSLD